MDGVGVERPDRRSSRHRRTSSRWSTDRRARRHRPRPTSPTTACTSRVAHRRGLRPARPPVARRHARRRRRSRGLRRRRQARPRRLRAVEAGQARRAVVAVAVGRRPARLAHRVRGDVARSARRGVRPALRRARTSKFPHHENERAQAVAARQALRQPLDAQRVRRRRRAARRCRRASATSTNLLDLIEHGRPAGLPHAAAAGPLPLAGRRSARTASDDAERGARAASTRSPGRIADVGSPPSPTPSVLERVHAPAWTTTSTRRARWRVVFDTVRRANAALDAGDDADRGAVLAAAVRVDLRGASASSCAADDEVPADVARAGRGPRRGPGRQGLRDAPTPCAPSCRPTGGSWRPPRRARPCTVPPDSAAP